jgi:acyl-CoA thioester hydrolase
MTEPSTDFQPQERASYRAWTHIPIRFADQDVLGHVNNGAISAYLEHARCEHLLPRIQSPEAPNLDIVLARIVIDYVKEIRYPGAVDVGVRIIKTGGKSFVIAGGVFKGDTCCATSEATIVFFDTATRRSTEPPAAAREALVALK